MATTTLSTDKIEQSAAAAVALMSDIWAFNTPVSVAVTLKTDLWYTLFAGALPAFSPSIVSAVARVQQALAFPKFVFGGLGGAAANEYKLFKKDTNYTFGVWRSGLYKMREPFKVNRIRIPLSQALTTGAEIAPVLHFDDDTVISVGTLINSVSYPNGELVIELTPDNFNQKVVGVNNFFLELQFPGTVLVGVTFPIHIETELIDSEN